MPRHKLALLFALLAPLALGFALATPAAGQQGVPGSGASYDVVIRNGRLLDGTGNPWVRADVGIRGDRIAAVGDLGGAAAGAEVDAKGLYVAPGFIDVHSHAGDDLEEADQSSAGPLLAQGVTTVFVNPDGGGAVDLEAQARALLEHGLGVNVARFVPFGSIRRRVMGMADRAPAEAELDSMRALVRAGMDAGALGLSTGLFYAPQSYSSTEEVVDLARATAPYGGVYQSHIRDEADYTVGVVAAVEEVIRIAREAGITGVATHVKVLGPHVWGYSAAVKHRIERARSKGVSVFADQYPYTASATGLDAALLPRWAQAGGDDSLRARLEDPATRERVAAAVVENLDRRGGADRLQFRYFAPDPAIAGMTLAEVADTAGVSPVEMTFRLVTRGSAGVVSHNMLEEDVRRFMRQPWTMTCSDGDLPKMGEGVPHPRSYGAFPRKLRRYALDEGVLPLSQAVRSMTWLPASVYGFGDRGILREGAAADVVVFDPETVGSPATFQDPHHLAEGMVHVLVNGVFAVRDRELTGALAGRVLSRGARLGGGDGAGGGAGPAARAPIRGR